MRKNLYLSIVGAIALAMTVVSCNSKSNEPTIEPLGNSGLSVITTPRGELGLKKGEETIITPSVDNKSFAVFDSFVLAKYDDGSQAVQRLLDPETGIEVVSGDSIINAGSYFIGTHSNGMSTIYVPASKFRFAGQQFAVSGSDAVSVFNGKITVYVDGKEAIPATSDYQKIALLKGKGDILVFKDSKWFRMTIGKDKAVALAPKDLKKFQAMKGWDDSSPVMILE